MTDPIFILGCHRSGTSVVAGLLHEACGVSMGELMPPTDDNPLGYFEAQGIVDAHRDLLFQMERDWTCPPATFRPAAFDLQALRTQIEIHRRLPGAWAVKDPRQMFLLRAWAHLGVERARIVGVVRTPSDTIRSIERRDGIREDRAEAIVEAYLQRLSDIARHVPVPVIRFSQDGADVLRQVKELAAALQLPWDQEVAESFFDEKLVRNRAQLHETSPAYDQLLKRAFDYRGNTVPSANLKGLRTNAAPPWPLDLHLSVRHAQQRHELWRMAQFSTHPEPIVAEFLLEGARPGGGHRPGVGELHQIEVGSALVAGAALMQRRLRPHAVVAPGLLSGRNRSDVQFFFRSMYVSTQLFAELVLDLPSPQGAAINSVEPEPAREPHPAAVIEIAELCGWERITTERLSPGRVGVMFRKRTLTDSELVPVVNDLLAGLDRLHEIDAKFAQLERRLSRPDSETEAETDQRALRRRAERAERDLARLRGRRSVRLALAAARPFSGVFHLVRTWKKSR